MKVRRSDLVRSFLRCFAVQGSWNYRDFLAGGLAYCLLPLLRRVHAGHPEALREAVSRHLRPFNAHPYLAAMAVGALARMERDGAGDEEIRRVRRALVGPLGAAGDRMVWTGWRPLCLLAAVAVYTLGAGPWTAVLLFLSLYNAGHLVLRAWAFRRGWRDGPRAAALLSGPGWRRLSAGLARGAGALAGGVAALLALHLAPVDGAAALGGGALAAVLAFAAGLRWPSPVGRAAAPLAGAALALAVLA